MRLLPKILKWTDVIMNSASDGFLFLGKEESLPDERISITTINTQEINLVSENPEQEILIDKARQEADQILQKAKEEAEKILKEAKKEAEKEAKKEFENAKLDGYEEGLKLGQDFAQEENRSILREIKEFFNTLEEQKSSVLESFEGNIKDLALGVAKKIIQTELDTKSDTFLILYKNAVQEMRDQDWIKLTVANSDTEFATSNSELLLSMVKGAKHIEISTLNIAPKGTCIVETEQGIVDASVYTQLEQLREAFLNAELAV
ncbi:MAG: FliH/SctL family protein [Clostridiales bacterium]|nr:FliH/SctL family protein [Clostridiales bacterium]